MIHRILNIIRRVRSNIGFFIHRNLYEESTRKDAQISILKREVNLLQYQLISLYQLILKKDSNCDINDVMDFIKSNNAFGLVPYPSDAKPQYTSGIEENYPYVIHNGFKLFFPETWNLGKAQSFYENYMMNERITKVGNEIGPHQYQSEDFYVRNGDVLVDVGCAEGLFALDVIDKIKYGYLIENDNIWIEPLRRTFSCFSDKICIVNKTLSNCDSKDSITLKSLLTDHIDDSIFIKMDIEGGEMDVVKGAERLLGESDKIKIASAVYHRITDADEMSVFFKKIGYDFSFSKGYILTSFLDNTGIPSLRQGIIRAWKR